MNIGTLLAKQRRLMEYVPHQMSIENIHRLIAGKGLIEEVLEYLNSTGTKPWRPEPLSKQNQLEELTDILFFFLELIALSGFTLGQIEKEYHRKWEVNMSRYEQGKAGVYDWDDRHTKKEL